VAQQGEARLGTAKRGSAWISCIHQEENMENTWIYVLIGLIVGATVALALAGLLLLLSDGRALWG